MDSTVQLGKDKESLKSLEEIDKSVAFVETLFGRYTWDEAEKGHILEDLDFIRRKRNDKNLNLSIIGEFSSGKSTFINALLRDNLLESANLQGTTTANTIIRYAPDYGIIIKYKDGVAKTFSWKNVRQRVGDSRSIISLILSCFGLFSFIFQSLTSLFRRKKTLHEFKERIKELTTNQSEANLIKEIIIEHPAEVLKSGITIIDTPGINSLERWHEEVTKSAIREISDVSVILTTADKPMPDTLNGFIKENLSDVLQQCIFVATKMDVLREKERKGQLDYIRQKISDAFKLSDPIVLPHTPMFVLGEANQKYRKTYSYERDDHQKLIEDSYKTETTIYQRLAQQRITIQVQKLSNVMSRTLSNLSSSINLRREEFKERYAILEKHQKPDFLEFINNMAEKYTTKFNKEYEKHREEMWKILNPIYDSQIQSIANDFFGLPDKDSLEPFYKNKMPEIFTVNATMLIRESHNHFTRLSEIATRILEDFWVEFSKIYSELATLDVKSANIKFNIDKKQIGTVSFDHNTLNQSFQNFDFKDNLTTFGGVGVGATIGTFILPGIGTIIGGAIGGFLGALFGPSLDKLKSNIWEQITPDIGQYRQDIYDYISNDIHQKYEKLLDHVVSQLEVCFDAYHELVASMRQQNEEERQRLEKYIAMTKVDSNEIQNILAFFGVNPSLPIHAPKEIPRFGNAMLSTNSCPSCNAVIEVGDSFCLNCGKTVHPFSKPGLE